MILEPMAEISTHVRVKDERSKLRTGLKTRVSKSLLGKRARDEDDGKEHQEVTKAEGETPKKKHAKRQKGVNPLSLLKPKKREVSTSKPPPIVEMTDALLPMESTDHAVKKPVPEGEKKKRKRKPSKTSSLIKPSTNEILTGRANLSLSRD